MNSIKNMDLTQKPTQDDSSIDPEIRANKARDHKINPEEEAKRLKKVRAGRIYSLKHRIKQYNYSKQLEGEVRSLQVEMAARNPRIKYTNLQNSLMRIENDSIKKTLSVLTTELMLKEAQYMELKRERDSLKQFDVINSRSFLEMNKHQPPVGFNHHDNVCPGPTATETVGTAGQMDNLNKREPHNFF